jgi:hypothetical protein
MKKKIIITGLFLFVCFSWSKAQGPIKEILSAAGDCYTPKGMDLILYWSLGDPVVESFFYDRCEHKLLNQDGLLSDSYSLSQNYPNPFNLTTNINYYLPEAANIRISLFDMIGREMKVIKEGSCDAGEYVVSMEAKGLAEGLYVYRLIAKGENSEFRNSKIMVVSQ